NDLDGAARLAAPLPRVVARVAGECFLAAATLCVGADRDRYRGVDQAAAWITAPCPLSLRRGEGCLTSIRSSPVVMGPWKWRVAAAWSSAGTEPGIMWVMTSLPGLTAAATRPMSSGWVW